MQFIADLINCESLMMMMMMMNIESQKTYEQQIVPNTETCT